MASISSALQPQDKGLTKFFVILAVIYGAGLLLAWWIEPKPVPFWTFTAEDVVRNLTPLLLVALFIERALEVFINTSRQQGADNLEHDIATLPVSDLEKLSLKKKECIEYTANTRRYAFIASLLIGFLVAVVGIRGIRPFVQLTVFEQHQLTSSQEFLFNAVDILLTAALLAGGAEGIHKVMNVFTNYADAAASKAKNG